MQTVQMAMRKNLLSADALIRQQAIAHVKSLRKLGIPPDMAEEEGRSFERGVRRMLVGVFGVAAEVGQTAWPT